MPRTVILPPSSNAPGADGSVAGGWWHDDEDRIVCDLCPRECALKPGDRGFCFVRENRDGEMLLTTYGKSTGFCIDPIEKKPLNQFFPGTSVLSFGTAGCNLGCKFCQNWDISKSREVKRLSEHATPDMIAAAAVQHGCKSVAFTYNDPIIWAEYAIDVAKACHEQNVKTVAVTAAYISEAARQPFFEHLDAANVDLKAFTEEFYHNITYSHLQPILDTLSWLRRETDVWFEITNLVIPRANDSDDEFRQMCDWILNELGDDVPVHFTAFHPDFRMQDRERTPLETLLRGYAVARKAGLKYVYVGNVNDVQHQSTYCPNCNQLVIERDWYQLGKYQLKENRCVNCNAEIAGHFGDQPGNWGRKRLPVKIANFGEPNQLVSIETPKRASNGSGDKNMNAPATTTPNQGLPGDVPRPELNDQQRQAALLATSEIVLAAVQRRPIQISDTTIAGAADIPVFGCFVSIKRKGKLRGCCGFLGRRSTLSTAIQESAKTSATGDVRMPSVSMSELEFLDFEIWLLYGQQAVTAQGEDRIDAVEIGKHGLQIQQGQNRGLLLPGVATDHGLDSEGFLRQVCMKAGLPPTAWRESNTLLATFEGMVVNGKFDTSILPQSSAPPTLLLTEQEVQSLADFCKSNILASAVGAVPNYYLPGCSDGSVHGVSLQLTVAGRNDPLHIAQLNSRQVVPMQSTLFQACQNMGRQLNAEGIGNLHPNNVQLQMAILYDPAMHGTVDNPDLGGIDTKYRAILVSQSSNSAWLFDPSLTAEAALSKASDDAKVSMPDRAMVNSFVIQSNTVPLSVVNVPKPITGPSARPAAVAGLFYPGTPDQLSKVVDECIPSDEVTKKKWRAAMVPHAGFMFSGKIAADVLRRIEFPETVIVIGPKHTAFGLDWAVAPNQTWQLPGFKVATDLEVAKRLCDEIEGLEMDAMAHQREHAIEVELPFLNRFAPQSKVVGIAIGSGTYEHCQKFANGLAKAISDRLDDTLLLISSDMNHYASDAETRRVDELAIAALEQLDPKNVLDTVRKNDISMCGVLPAVITLQTLVDLGLLTKAHRVAYATSGDVSDDKSRVVGYAGMLFE